MNTNTTTEEWRDVVGHEDLYEVSNLGNVRSKRRVIRQKNGVSRYSKPRQLKLTPTGQSGYLAVSICTGHKRFNRTVHSIVAEAFLGLERGTGLQVNHRDLNRTNNHVDNLEVVTPKGNIRHSVKAGSFCPAHNANLRQKLDPETVRQIAKDVLRGDEPQWKLAERYGVTQSMVSAIKTGKCWQQL